MKAIGVSNRKQSKNSEQVDTMHRKEEKTLHVLIITQSRA